MIRCSDIKREKRKKRVGLFQRSRRTLGIREEPAFPMRARWLLSEMWPVRSWTSVLACLLGRFLMRTTNFSMVRSRLLHSVEKSAKIVNLSFLLNDCSSADLLSGSVIELPLLISAESSWLEVASGSFLGSCIYCSFPGMLAWSGTHWMSRRGNRASPVFCQVEE